MKELMAKKREEAAAAEPEVVIAGGDDSAPESTPQPDPTPTPEPEPEPEPTPSQPTPSTPTPTPTTNSSTSTPDSVPVSPSGEISLGGKLAKQMATQSAASASSTPAPASSAELNALKEAYTKLQQENERLRDELTQAVKSDDALLEAKVSCTDINSLQTKQALIERDSLAKQLAIKTEETNQLLMLCSELLTTLESR